MSGALAERVFVDKLTKVGFHRVEVLERQPFSLADVEQYPLFTPDLIELAAELLTPDQQAEMGVAVTLTAHKPSHQPRLDI